jgi:hypothetical protein
MLLFFVFPALGDAAANFYMDQTCMPDNSVTLAFSWDGGSSGVRQQWVDVSAKDTWAAGSFTGAGPFAEGVQAYNWPGYKSGTTFYVRFNQQTASGSWDPTRTYRFTVKACGAGAGTSSAPAAGPTQTTQPVTAGAGSASTKDPKNFLGSYNPGLDFCDYAKCVENFFNGGGSLVQCKDGYYSLSGGKPGSCSGHGGNS